MTATTNIYEEILANIDADKKAWCKGDWATTDKDGRPVSRCLVEHIDLAVGTSYVKPDGKVFVSKDLRKYKRRERILSHLAALLPRKVILGDFGYYEDDEIPEQVKTNPYYDPEQYAKDREAAIAGVLTPHQLGDYAVRAVKQGIRRPYSSQAENAVVGFNDADTTNKAKVRNLLKRAAKSHPED